MLDLVAVGDVLLDVIGPSAEAPGVHHPVAARAGGSAVNAARTARGLGASAAVVGRVGDDPAGRAIADELERAGIEAHLSLDSGRPTGIAVYRGAIVLAGRGANAAFAPVALPPARVTLMSGYLPREAVQTVLGRARGLTAIDLQGVLDDGFGAAVVLGPGLDLDRFAPLHDAAVATRGAEGATATLRGARAAAAPPVVRDEQLIGAGDAFAAAFLLALADGETLEECLARGCAAGSAV